MADLNGSSETIEANPFILQLNWGPAKGNKFAIVKNNNNKGRPGFSTWYRAEVTHIKGH